MNAADRVMTGLMWPPDMGRVARTRTAIVIQIRNAIISFGESVFVSYEEITMVSIMNTKTAVPRSSAIDARQT